MVPPCNRVLDTDRPQSTGIFLPLYSRGFGALKMILAAAPADFGTHRDRETVSGVGCATKRVTNLNEPVRFTWQPYGPADGADRYNQRRWHARLNSWPGGIGGEEGAVR